MKLFIIGFALIALSAGEFSVRTVDDLTRFRTECVAEHSLTDTELTEVRKWNFNNDEKTRCYVKCVLAKMGFFDEETGAQTENIIKQLSQTGDEANIRTEAAKCADTNETGDSSCVWAFRLLECFRSNHLDLLKSSLQKN